jgi:hypothetical protein
MANEFATSASGEILQQFVDEIATDLENHEAKRVNMSQRRKKHGVGTHSPNRRARRDRERLQARPKQHAKDVQMKRTEEEEATTTNQTGEGDR